MPQVILQIRHIICYSFEEQPVKFSLENICLEIYWKPSGWMFTAQLVQPDSVHIAFGDFIIFSQVYQWVQLNISFFMSSFNP